ncbi:hypothetical protein FQA39_LY18193 [Lamprigera yunnana]|nr:hypothetical protein FQA39_LY18193 [Lamprigera yunnana]
MIVENLPSNNSHYDEELVNVILATPQKQKRKKKRFLLEDNLKEFDIKDNKEFKCYNSHFSKDYQQPYVFFEIAEILTFAQKSQPLNFNIKLIVIKEPPYSVKESGYAGFTLPVEIYLRNKDEPKKLSFNYDLHLQPSGAPISEVQSKKYVFSMPPEDFKLKLLKGGGVIVNSSISQDVTQESRTALDEKSQLLSKPRLGGSDVIKKHKSKIDDPRSSFQALFGAPITKTSKTTVEPKPTSKDKNSNLNKSASVEKEKSKNKHSPHKESKDKEKEKLREKEDKFKRDTKKGDEKKERSKDREDRSKEKRREKSPKMCSPTPTKRPSSPKRPLSPQQKHKDEKKIEANKDKKVSDEREKLEKKIKKEKRDKDKERRDSNRYKDREQKSVEQKENKNLLKDKHKEESLGLPSKNGKEKIMKEKEVLKDYIKEGKESAELIDKNGKIKGDRLEEKTKHKHKKKDKDKKDKLSDKTHKSEKKLEKPPAKYVENKDAQKENEKTSLFDSPKQMSSTDSKVEKSKKPLNTLLSEFVSTDTSNSSISSPEDLFNEPAPVLKVEPKKETYELEVKVESDRKAKKEKSKKNKEKKFERNVEKKKKRKLDSNSLEEPLEKIPKEESSNSKESDNEGSFVQEKQTENEENYEDYMNILRDLQHKILTLQDNAELQRVVQLIAETGRFEVSAQTFDFDLCLLERSTITQLQNFFESTS